MANAASTTLMPGPEGSGSPDQVLTRPRLRQRRLDPLPPHDLMRHVARDAVGHVGDIAAS